MIVLILKKDSMRISHLCVRFGAEKVIFRERKLMYIMIIDEDQVLQIVHKGTKFH